MGRAYGTSVNQKKLWDIEEVLAFTNPDKGCPTCPAEARTYGRRCRRDVAAYNVHNIRAILEGLTTSSPLEVCKSSSTELYDAAERAICWQHQRDINIVVRGWKQKLETKARDLEDEARSHPDSDIAGHDGQSAKPEPDESDSNESDEILAFLREAKRMNGGTFASPDLEALFEKRREQLRRRKFSRQEQENKTFYASREDQERQKARDEGRKKREERERQQREQERKENEEQERRQREEKDKKEREEQERKERERAAQEQREREESERRQKEERERKEHEEKIRERARKRAQERDEAVKRGWINAWKLYSEGWDRFQETESQKKIDPDEIPWPVKSGRWEDVTESNVKVFFQKAAPILQGADAGEERFKLASQENKKWHTDKITARFGKSIFEGKYGDALNVIAKTMVELRKEAQKDRRG